MSRWSLRLCVGALAAIALAGCASGGGSGSGGSSAGGPINVGVTAPLSGALAASGQDTVNAVKLGADQVNARGGIDGRKIKVIPEDDACDAQTGVQAAEKLVTENVVAIVGGYCSGATIPEVGVLQRSGNIPFVAGLSSDPALTQQGYKNVFRVAPNDLQSGPSLVTWMKDELHVTKIALGDDGLTFSVGLCKVVTTDAKKVGLDVVYQGQVTPGQNDYTSILTKVSTTPAQLFFYCGNYPEFGLMIKEWGQLHDSYLMMGQDSAANPALITTAAGAGKNPKVSFVINPNGNVLKTPLATAFYTAFKKQFGHAPDPYAVFGYDSMSTFVKALEQDGAKTSASELNAALRKISLTGITGPISFDAKGDRNTPPTAYAVRIGGSSPDFVAVDRFVNNQWVPVTS